MRARHSFVALVVVAALALTQASSVAAADKRLVATLKFEVGAADLTAAHRATLDELLGRYPVDFYVYSFEGDHDPMPFDNLTPNASRRVNERLAETRWQNIAIYLSVRPYGLVRPTGNTEVRIFVEERADAADSDSLEVLKRQVEDLKRQLGAIQSGMATSGQPAPRATTAPPETVLSIARIEKMYVRPDKWVDDQWWESQGGIELGLLRVTPDRTHGRPSGAMLRIAGGTPAHMPFEITTRFDLFRLGTDRIGITPALRWYDWNIRLHYGDDREAPVSFVNKSDPVYLLGLDLDIHPWSGNWVKLEYAGVGSRVHAAERIVKSYDHFDLQIEQRIAGQWRLELQAIYDERFEKSVPYAGGWIAYAWPMKLGEFITSVGYVNQLDALGATTGTRYEDLISTVSFGFTWRRARH